MKIFDCFMYFDEDLVLDIRLNTLDKYVDFFVIIESKYNHKGETKKLNFDSCMIQIKSDIFICTRYLALTNFSSLIFATQKRTCGTKWTSPPSSS